MRAHNLEFDMLLRGIVMGRGENGATIDEMRTDYYNVVCKPWPLKELKTDQIIKYLMEIDGLMMEKLDPGPCIWYIDDIGSNISDRYFDSNNNVVVSVSEDRTASEDRMVTLSDISHKAQNNSYEIQPPRISRRMVTSSFVNGAGTAVASSSSNELLIESIETVSEKNNRKRQLSKDSTESLLNADKRKKTMQPLCQHGLPLIAQNLDIHNRNGGTNGLNKQATSTEIENSIFTGNQSNDCIGAIDCNEYIAPIHGPQSNHLIDDFAKRCDITGKSSTEPTDSSSSSMSREENLIPSDFGLIGDDFMRSLISFELYGADFTSRNDKNFGYCISAQTVRAAYHMVLDKQCDLKSKYQYLIINVGAIDILLERDLIDIEAEYARLIKAVCTIGLRPIITTIPNVYANQNNPNVKIIYQILLLFNNFLMSTFGDAFPVIDLYSSFKTQDNKTNQFLYHYNSPKYITVNKKPLEIWHWTENGRKNLLNEINSFIAKHLVA